MKVFQGKNPNVWKYVFDFDGAPAEAVLYRYPTFKERTVLCISVQSGCPVGCTFCGTGNKFVRNLSTYEMLYQVSSIISEHNINTYEVQKLQIMFMSMGEPFLNYNNVKEAIHDINALYPNADLLVSTIAPNKPTEFKSFIDLSKQIDKVGLQFSIHESFDYVRNKLIPFKNKMSLLDIRNYGIEWYAKTGRKPYCNYCITGKNNAATDFGSLQIVFPPNVFCFTFSVVCSYDETMKDAGYRNLEQIKDFEQRFIRNGYDTRVFDPAGQDDIGGGCGQLWYVQKKLKEANEINKQN